MLGVAIRGQVPKVLGGRDRLGPTGKEGEAGASAGRRGGGRLGPTGPWDTGPRSAAFSELQAESPGWSWPSRCCLCFFLEQSGWRGLETLLREGGGLFKLEGSVAE